MGLLHGRAGHGRTRPPRLLGACVRVLTTAPGGLARIERLTIHIPMRLWRRGGGKLIIRGATALPAESVATRAARVGGRRTRELSRTSA
jgi:hypothetical protein